jgi:tetratricopeptide (TPR) repeat protein
LSNLKNCTVVVKCKVITGLLEISHCENVTLKISKSATVVTIQADLCQNLNVEFHDAPSGKGITETGRTIMFWGEDKDDRIFHAGVSNMNIKTYRDGFVDLEKNADFLKDGAKPVGNATAEEVQFITSVVDGELLTEKVLKNGSATGTTVSGAFAGAEGDSGSGARAMTAREMEEVKKRKEQIRKSVDERLGGIKILDKDGNEVPVQKKSDKDQSEEEEGDVGDGDIIEEVYAGMTQSDIDHIIKDCDAQKAKGNEAFVAGEYTQAVLLYSLSLDKAAELPDASGTGVEGKQKQLFPRHIVLSNRSACFLKLGHHEKALKDGIEAERLEPSYVKGVFRKGLAHHAMGNYQEAITALAAAQKIEPKNKQIKQALQFAEVKMHREMSKRMGR